MANLVRGRDGQWSAVARSDHSGQWEIVGVPEATVRLFSKRDREIRAFLDALGLTWAEATDGERRAARDATRDAKDPTTDTADDDELRTKWQTEGRAHGDDPEHIVAAVLGQNRTAPNEVSLDAIRAQVLDPETGLTARGCRFRFALAATEDLHCRHVSLAASIPELKARRRRGLAGRGFLPQATTGVTSGLACSTTLFVSSQIYAC